MHYRTQNRQREFEHMQAIHLAAKLDPHERQHHHELLSNGTNAAHKIPSPSSPTYLETSEQLKKEQDYHSHAGSIFDMSHNRYPYARELIESYQQRLNLQSGKKDEEEEEEEVIVDTDTANVNMVGVYPNRETQNETSNIPEDLSNKGRKRSRSTEESNEYHPYTHEKTPRVQSPSLITQSPEEQVARQSPNANVDTA